MQKIEYKSRYLKHIDNEIIFCYISVGKRIKYRKEITIYVFTKNYNEKEIGKYASAGKDKLWLRKSHYYDVDFGSVFYCGHRCVIC